MSTKEYAARLKTLSDSNKDIVHRTTQLSKLVPDPASAAQSEQVRTDLSDDIHSSLKDLEADFELFRQEAEDAVSAPGGTEQRRRSAERDNERIALITQIERFGEDLRRSRAQYRKASLQAKRNEEEAQRRARERLFAAQESEDGSTPAAAGAKRRGRNEGKSQDELVLSAASDVTSALRRLHQGLNDSLGRQNFAKEILETSTRALQELDETYSGAVEDGLKAARGLVNTLISSNKSDTWYLETALYILLATTAWLIFRRWFFGPLLYLVWKPGRFMLSVVYSALNLTLGVLTGTIFSSGQDLAQQPQVQSNTRPPLIIKPSAQRGANIKRQGTEKPSVKVGLGGGGSAEGRSPEDKRKDEQALLDELAKMADHVKDSEKGMGEAGKINQENSGSAGQVVRGDGTVLRDRAADEPKNPKKRVLEEPPQEPVKNKDEL